MGVCLGQTGPEEILVANSFSRGASLLTDQIFRHLPNMNCADF
jgi:hypothetical protein